MRHISFAMTKPQVRRREKTVTRRTGWERLPEPGTCLQGIEQGQGLKAGETVKKMDVIRVVDARREPLRRMTDDPAYGAEECRKEGFPEMTPEAFVAFFCAGHRIKEIGEWPEHRVTTRRCTPDDDVTRIEYEYVDPSAEAAIRDRFASGESYEDIATSLNRTPEEILHVLRVRPVW
jgi:hypothetical protein